jgi:hypothetical protein
MRFFEFAPTATPVLKISQQQLQQHMIQRPAPQVTNKTNTSGSPAAPPPASPLKPTIKVYPKAWQHAWVQKYLAAKMAQDAQTVQPAELDIIKAMMRYADVQRQADRDYQQLTGEPDAEIGWQGEHRWVKRDEA